MEILFHHCNNNVISTARLTIYTDIISYFIDQVNIFIKKEIKFF